MIIEVKRGKRVYKLRRERPGCWHGWLCATDGSEVRRHGYPVVVIDQPNARAAIRALRGAGNWGIRWDL